MRFTVFGSKGFIGSALTNYLKLQNIECLTPNVRNEVIPKENLGHVVYAVGVSDFKQKAMKAIDAHVLLLNRILNKTKFESFLYLSSTRVYYNTKSTTENSPLVVNPSDFDNLYNISKIMGEAICNISKQKNVRIVRLSNVVGNNFNSNIFLPSIIQDALKTKKIILQSKLDSEKDYVYIDDALNMMLKISLQGKNSIYNIASGQNIKNNEIVNKLKEITGCKIEVMKNVTSHSFPPISIKRIQKEFNFEPISILNKFEKIVSEYEEKLNMNKND